jgi:hypothetical protein
MLVLLLLSMMFLIPLLEAEEIVLVFGRIGVAERIDLTARSCSNMALIGANKSFV